MATEMPERHDRVHEIVRKTLDGQHIDEVNLETHHSPSVDEEVFIIRHEPTGHFTMTIKFHDPEVAGCG